MPPTGRLTFGGPPGSVPEVEINLGTREHMPDSTNRRKSFHHVGLTALEEQPQEDLVAPSKCWVTDPRDHPMRIEFLRYAPDSPVSRK